MNKKPTVSVIIPVYGVEDYIEKCLQSLLDQTFTDFEAIIVDDGSLDQSIPKAKKIVGDDPRFVFLEKENGGQASARNMGLDYARGEYISFLDADDSIEINTLMDCINTFNKNPSTDIVMFGIKYIMKNKTLNTLMPNIKKYTSEKDLLLIHNSVDNSPCNKIYRASIFKNKDLRFKEGMIFEDLELVVKLLFNKELLCINKYYYNYTQRDGSTMHSYKSLFVTNSYLNVLNSQKKFLKENNLWDSKKNDFLFSYMQLLIINNFVQITKYSTDFSKDSQYLMKKIDNKIFTFWNILRTYKKHPKKMLLLFFFKISPFLTKKLINTYEVIK